MQRGGKQLGYTRVQSIWQSIAQAAEEHGYTNTFGKVLFFLKYIRSYLLNILAMHVPGGFLPVLLQRARGVRIGRGVFIGEDVFIDPVYPHLITIEDEVLIAPRVTLLAHSKPNWCQRNRLKAYCAPIVIKRGAFIGVGATILAGVTIGERSVVGACSLVVRDIPKNTFAVGVPAKPIKKYSDY